MTWTLTDFENGRPIEVGTFVRYFEGDAEVGIVTDLGEFDVDDRDDMRPRWQEPFVTVRYADGIEEKYPTCEWEFDGYPDNEPVSGKVEELDVLTDEELKALPRTTFASFEEFQKDNPKLMKAIERLT